MSSAALGPGSGARLAAIFEEIREGNAQGARDALGHDNRQIGAAAFDFAHRRLVEPDQQGELRLIEIAFRTDAPEVLSERRHHSRILDGCTLAGSGFPRTCLRLCGGCLFRGAGHDASVLAAGAGVNCAVKISTAFGERLAIIFRAASDHNSEKSTARTDIFVNPSAL
jgi:hypothetical protein